MNVYQDRFFANMHYIYSFQLLYIATWLPHLIAQQCFPRQNGSGGVRCIDKDGISDVHVSDCFKNRHCCVSRNTCYVKPSKSPEIVDEIDEEDMMIEAESILQGLSRAPRGRSLIIGPSIPLPYGGEDPYPGFSALPPFVCQKRPSFLEQCENVDVGSARFSRSPPLDIPYCLRIPCDPKNPVLDIRPSDCRATPGCYFDRRLSDHRAHYGHSFMPGVPVCHLAIRNAVFQEEAQKIVKKTGSWSSYLTECLLEIFDDVIRWQKDGCRHIPMLEYFNHKPKIAGWKSIKEYDCVLLDACWINGRCYYPVDIMGLAVRQATSRSKVPSALYYGRPKCQEFNDKTPRAAIKSYHTCLISGCKVDIQAHLSYYHYLYEFGKTMKISDHWVFWRNVESGKYGAHNLDEYDPLPKQDVTVTPFSVVIPYPAPRGEADLLSEVLSPGSASILDMLKASSDGIELPPSHTNPSETFFQQLQGLGACSSTFTSFGSRPCGPPKYKPTGSPEDCPFKPVTVKGLKPLQGSLEGCCDVNLCYHPKDEIPTARSGAAVYLSEWSYWTECSTTCGKGSKKRWRKCIGIGRSKCKGKLVDKASCQAEVCSSWTQWSGWTPCPVTCGGGLRSRTRKCRPKGGNCPGEREEVNNCATSSCDSAPGGNTGPWSKWVGSCDPCGKTMIRNRSCLIAECPQNELFQTRRCVVRCGSWTTWSSWSACAYDHFTVSCQRSRRRSCLDSRGSPADCVGNRFHYQTCMCP